MVCNRQFGPEKKLENFVLSGWNLLAWLPIDVKTYLHMFWHPG
jgi:hypothetical protein